jgi:hypothetical protein
MMVQPRHNLCLPLACPSSPSQAKLNCPCPFPCVCSTLACWWTCPLLLPLYTALLCPVSLYLCLPASLERRFFGRRKDPSQPTCPVLAYISYDSRPIAVASPLHSHSQAKVRRFLAMRDEAAVAGAGGGTGATAPCAACKLLRRRCAAGCVFAPHFPPAEPHKFANVHRVFGASNVSKLLQVRAHESSLPASVLASFLLLAPPTLPRLGYRSGTLFLLCHRLIVLRPRCSGTVPYQEKRHSFLFFICSCDYQSALLSS